MNQTDKMELSELRAAMWEIFQRVARVDQHKREIEMFIRSMDRHQEILAGDVEEEK